VVDTTFVRFRKNTGQIVSVAITDAAPASGVTWSIGPLDALDTGVVWSIAAKADVTSNATWTVGAAGAVVTGVAATPEAKANVDSGVTWTIPALAAVTSGFTATVAAAAPVTSGAAWTTAALAEVDTGVTWAVNSPSQIDTGVTWTINDLAEIDTGITWSIGDLVEEDTGVTFDIAALSGQSTAAEVAEVIRGTTIANWNLSGTGASVIFESTSFGNKTDATYSAGATGATGAIVTTPQGVTGNQIISAVAMSGTNGAIVEHTLVGAGVIQSLTADYTATINIDSEASCDMFVQMQKLTTTMG
jgi:hypothetical protein